MYTKFLFFFQAEDGIRDRNVTGVQTCALPISSLGVEVGSCRTRSRQRVARSLLACVDVRSRSASTGQTGRCPRSAAATARQAGRLVSGRLQPDVNDEHQDDAIREVEGDRCGPA